MSRNKIKEYKCSEEERDYKLVFSEADTKIEEHTLGELLEDLETNYIIDNIAIQRDSGLWSAKDSSLLIHTILAGLSILPISLDQKGTGDGAVRRLTDGKQRLNVCEAFKNNEFALYKMCPPVTIECVKTTPMLDDKGNPVRKNRKIVMVPVTDENGNPMMEKKQYKLAGKRFSQLPDDLRRKFLRYKKMKQIVHINYTDAETQLQMMRDNTSVKMTPAQVGVVVSGEDLAAWLKSFREHKLFLDHSNYTLQQKKKSCVERTLVEATLLAYDADKWNASYAKNNDLFIANDTEERRIVYRDLIDEFDEVISKHEYLWDKLENKNMNIIIAAYCHFCDKWGSENKDIFGEFLCKWFEEIKDTTEYEVEGNTGTKHKKTVLEKLAIISDECGKYIESMGIELNIDVVEEETVEESETVENEETENSENMDVIDVHEETSAVADEMIEDFVQEYGADEREAMSAVMELDGRTHFRCDFSDANIDRYIEFFKENPDKELIDRCELIHNKILDIDMNEYSSNNEIVSKYNLPIFIRLYDEFMRRGESEEAIANWIKSMGTVEDAAFIPLAGKTFYDYTEEDIDWTSNGTIITKYSILRNSYEKYNENNKVLLAA